MPMIKAITQSVERALEQYQAKRARLEAERLTDMQFAREMRARSLPGSVDYLYYNSIVKQRGGK